MTIFRFVALALLVVLLALYIWLTFRSDGRLMTVPGMPRFVWIVFDYSTNFRNFPAFFVLGGLGAAVVAGLGPKWHSASLAVCLLAPLLKDVAQLPMATRHFHWGAIAYGVVGALCGWLLLAGSIHWVRRVE